MMAAALLCGGCSMRGLIDKMVSDEDRALAMRTLDQIRKVDAASLTPLLAPEIRASSQGELIKAKSEFPAAAGSTEIVAFNTSSNYTNGVTSKSKSFTLVTTDQQLWTTTTLQFQGNDGPLMLTGWRVVGAKEKPAELQFLDTMETVLPIVGIVVLLFVVGLIALIVFLVRRSQRKARERGYGPPR